MLRMNYDEIVEKIINESGAVKGEIEAKVENKLKQLGDLVSKEGAAHIVANELGVKIFDLEKKDFKIKDLFVGIRNIELSGKILRKYEVREFKTERGEGKVMRILLGDETGSIMAVVWDSTVIDSFEKYNESDVIRISNGYVRENNGLKEIHLGKDSGVERSNENISVAEFKPQRLRKKISELGEGDFCEISGTVVQLFEPRFYIACPECNKKIEGSNCEKHGTVTPKEVPVFNFFFDDGSDSVRVVAFRENAEKILGAKGEGIKEKKFEDLRRDVLGKQFMINGKVVKNEMTNTNEFIANEVGELNALEVANELVEDF